MTSPPLRIYRQAGPTGRLLLDDGQSDTHWDLSAFLQRRGQPTHLRDLFEIGWFDRERLERILPMQSTDPYAEGWQAVPLGANDRVPDNLATPLDPSEVGKILCLGKNFRAHAEEFGESVPEEMLFFNKLPETLRPHACDISVDPHYRGRVDHEAEVAVVIGWEGKHIKTEDALDHVAGYSVANDLTARTLQGADRKRGHPWFRAKNMDGFCPMGPAFVPRDYLDSSALRVTAHVNGQLRQDGSTRDWVIDLPTAIARLSAHLHLQAGDIILMGTPAGVSPLEDGDEVTCSVTGIGDLTTTIRRPLPTPEPTLTDSPGGIKA